MDYLIGIDVGTSGTKTALFDTKGNTVMKVTVEYPLYTPKEGWAEQKPEDWYNAVIQGLRIISKEYPDANILAIGLTGQMHGLVMLDDEGEVLRDSIIWCDQRTEKECGEITKRVKNLVEITANPAITGFTASKILWVRNNEYEIYKKCRHILLPKDYIRYKLTGTFATDVSDASGMQLLDIKRRSWSKEVLDDLDIDINLLPQCFESVEITGYLTESAARLCGLKSGIPVVAGGGDNAASAIGTGVCEDGKAFTTIGTSGVVFVHTKEMKVDSLGRVHTFCAAVPGEYHVMGVTQGAGLSLKWFRDNFCQEIMETSKLLNMDPYQLMDEKAGKVPIGSRGLYYLPYLMGERTPHLDPNVKGAFLGITARNTKEDFIRAVMEGVSFSLKDCLKVFGQMGIFADNMTLCGGGSKSALWAQMISDVFNLPISTLDKNEGAAFGAAILAGTGAGVYESVKAAAKVIKQSGKFYPNEENVKVYEKLYGKYTTLYEKIKDI